MLEQNHKIQKIWYQLFLERLHYLIPRPPKWLSSSIPQLNAIVLFVVSDGQKAKSSVLWRLGRISSIEASKRRVTITYPDQSSAKSKPKMLTVVRSIRDVSVIFDVNDLGLNTNQHWKSLSDISKCTSVQK